jgi:hypothetical protein
MDELNHLGWVVYKSYDIDGYLIGIRTNSEVCAEWLESVLGRYEVSDEEAEPYFSLWVPEQKSQTRKQYYVLYREADDILRVLDPAKLAQRLLSELETFTLRNREDALFLASAVVSRDGVSALVPTVIVPYIRLAGRRVERELVLPVHAAVGVTPDGRLFSVPQQLNVPADACEDLAYLLGVEGEADMALDDVPDQVDLVCAFHYDPKQPPLRPLTRAMAVEAVAETAFNLRATSEIALDALAGVVEGARCLLLQDASAKSTFELVKGVLEGDAELELAAAG